MNIITAEEDVGSLLDSPYLSWPMVFWFYPLAKSNPHCFFIVCLFLYGMYGLFLFCFLKMWDFISYQLELPTAFPRSLNLWSLTANIMIWADWSLTATSLLSYTPPTSSFTVLVWGHSRFSFLTSPSSFFLFVEEGLWPDNRRPGGACAYLSEFLPWAGWAARPWCRLADRTQAGQSEDSQYGG